MLMIPGLKRTPKCQHTIPNTKMRPQPKTSNTKVSGVSVICVLSRGFQTRFEASQNYFKSLYMGLLVYMNASNIYRITLEAE